MIQSSFRTCGTQEGVQWTLWTTWTRWTDTEADIADEIPGNQGERGCVVYRKTGDSGIMRSRRIMGKMVLRERFLTILFLGLCFTPV